MKIPKKPLEVTLMLWSSLMVLLLELGVFDKCLAVLAPVFRLQFT